MKSTVATLIKTLTIIFSISFVFAKPYNVPTTHEPNLAINLVQMDNEKLSGHLINADESFFVFSNTNDESVQLIPREEVSVLETNIGVNLFQIVKSKDSNKMTDRIELEDGTMINCIILDVGNESIQYFTGQSLRRYVLSSEDVYMLHMADAVQIPFPMLAAASPAI